MFNTGHYNSFRYNAMPTSLGITSDYLIKYDNFTFQSRYVCISTAPNIDDMPELNFQNYNIAQADGMGNSEYTLQNKSVTFSGWIRTPTREETQSVIDSIKKSCYKPGQKLSYKRRDGKELYTTAYCTDLRFDNSSTAINYIPFTVTFTTLEPFWYDSKKSELSIINQSEGVIGSVIYVEGVYKAQPAIYISFTNATNVDTITLTLGDERISLNETVSDGDFVAIDAKNKDILLNGIGGRDYIGTFPVLPIGETPFLIDINGERTADIYIQWENTYV